MLAVISLVVAFLLDEFIPEECVIESISDSIHSVSRHVNVTLNSAQEGLAYELPSNLMFVTGVLLLVFGLASLVAGARLAETLFALCLATAVGFLLVQEESRDFLQEGHLEVELLTTWATTSWWGNMSTEPELRGAEIKFPMDLTCAFTLFVTTFFFGLTILLAPMLLKVALIVAGLFAGVLSVRLVGQFVPQLLYRPSPDTPVFLGYPLTPFWVLALALSTIAGAMLLTGSKQRLVLMLITSMLGSFGALKGVTILNGYEHGDYVIEAAGGKPQPQLLAGLVQLSLFSVGIMLQFTWCAVTEPSIKRAAPVGKHPYQQLPD